MLDGLAEADAGVEADVLLGDPRLDGEGEPLLEEGLHLGDDVLVARVVLHRPRLAEHVHEAEVGVAVRDDTGELRVAAQRRHVVDHAGAELERAPRHLRLRGVHGQRDVREALSDGLDPASSSSAVTPSEPGRVDSPPMSTIAAPCSTKPRASATAASGRRKRPPSEKESGVTFTTPSTDGRGKACSSGGLTWQPYPTSLQRFS